MRRLRAVYPRGPLHLIGGTATLAVAALGIRGFFDSDRPELVLIWFVGAIVLHDVVFLPIYSLADRIQSHRPARTPGAARFARARMHVRVPAMLAGLLLLVYFPLILRLQRGDFRDASGLTPDPFLHRWLVATAGLFALSLAVFGLRVARDRRRRQPR